ncbi:MAG: hypothetical protein Q8L51_00205, partial [Candidatus Amesbacteria bacterium]|nr:hypothetical protein [Candidatus Amesbacteria bacterium]
SLMQFMISVLVFLITMLPQIIFDIRHDNILSDNITNFLFEKDSFRIGFLDVIKLRIPFYFNTYFSNIFPSDLRVWYSFGLLALISMLVNIKKIHPKIWTVIGILISVCVGMLFFRGNNGNVYGYYFTGSYLLFIIVFTYLISIFPGKKFGSIIYFLFILVFIKQNLPLIKNYLSPKFDSPTTINFKNQKLAIDWIYNDTKDREFNIDVYVPPVIPYAYEYLFTWLGNTKYHKLPKTESIPNLYLLYEQDPPHPERLEKWMIRQNTYAKVEVSANFGGITVERRIRFPKNL